MCQYASIYSIGCRRHDSLQNFALNADCHIFDGHFFPASTDRVTC